MNRTWILVCCTLLSATSAFAVEWSSYGLDLLSEQKQDKQTIYRLADKNGREFSVVSTDEPTEDLLRRIVEFQRISRSWTRIRIASVNYVLYPSELEINVRVSGLIYEDVDLVPYITAGIGLYFSESLQYAFRLSVNRTYPRVSGPYSTEDELCRAMLKTLRLVQGETDKKPNVEPPIPTPIPTPIPAPAPPPAPSPAPAVPDPASTALAARLSGFDDQLAALKAENAGLRADLEILRKAVLTLSNLGIFGDVRLVDGGAIQRVLALKKEKPTLLQEEAADILRKENYKLSSYEVFLIFSVYFNEFR